jgi:integrase
MSVFKRPGAETYSFNFQVRGRRVSGNTQARNKKDAEAVERGLRAKAKADIEAERRTGNGPPTLNDAAGRYWQEAGKDHRDNAATHRNLARLIEYFGSDKRLDEIGDADVSGLIAWRRAQTLKGRKGGKTVSHSTVNRSATEVLRKLFTRARKAWGYQFREPNWSQHRLKEPQGRVRELHAHEERALAVAGRSDYAPWINFALLTGLRRAETLIAWACVNWEARTIITTGKGGRRVSTPLTEAVAAILEPLRGHHPEAVFTYVCRRPKRGHKKGERLPLTYAGAKSEWQAMRKRAGVKGFRFHDIRHDFATKLLRETGNLKLVSRALNHTDVKTTARYAHVVDSDLSEALQGLSLLRQKSHEKSHADPDQMTQITDINKKVS